MPDFVSGTWARIMRRHAEGDADRVSAEAKKALADPALQAKLVDQGIVPMGNQPGGIPRLRRRGDRAEESWRAG